MNQGNEQMNEIRILVGKNKKEALYELRVFIEKK